MILGIDEAGRGPISGPVVVAGVVLNPARPVEGLTDSKKLSPKKRAQLTKLLIDRADAFCVIPVSVYCIDTINILQATLIGMKTVARQLDWPQHGLIQVDGNQLPQWSYFNSQAIVKGDATQPCIAAASILAKHYRDTLMEQYDVTYPNYGFAQHKGYPTKQHLQAIHEYGVLPIHRRSFRPVAQYLKSNKK